MKRLLYRARRLLRTAVAPSMLGAFACGHGRVPLPQRGGSPEAPTPVEHDFGNATAGSAGAAAGTASTAAM
ncbi:MAG: hypothetical protein OEZ06_30570 [Myxococcales bacterium]|nr:hypothetical protein [Myxococcales bacterium]